MENRVQFDKIFGEKWMQLKEFEDLVKSEYTIKLLKFLAREYKRTNIFPNKKDIFRIFRETDPKNIRVVILGQDPYTTGAANGFAFANNDDVFKASPSLIEIWKAVEKQYDKTIIDFDVTLESWVDQGVFLYNSALTVQKGMVNGHLNIWKQFTREVLNIIIDNNPGCIFCLWGNKAQATFNNCVKPSKFKFVERLTCPHPAFAARRGVEWQCNHFKQIDEIISNQNGDSYVIDWVKSRK